MLEQLRDVNGMVGHWAPIWQALLRVILLVGPILGLVPLLIWWERRLLSWMQDRIGPNRVGPFGLLQPIADGVKLFFKEDITPSAIDKLIYFIAPGLALFPAFALGGTLPWGPWRNLTPIADVNIGVLYMMAISSLGVYGIVLAGYASDNKYSLMGGLRSSAQLISYELSMGMALAGVVLASGSLRMTDMITAQEAPLLGTINYIQNWNLFTPFGFVSGLIFMICMIAETNRAPFDLPEAENELIAGYHTEYSSMKFAVFFMGEYAAMFIFSGIFATVFLGGYNALPIRWNVLAELDLPLIGHGLSNSLLKIGELNYMLAPVWFIGKITFFISFYIWLRATLPRLRYDQLMSLGWKTMLPVATANFVLVGFWMLMTSLYGTLAGVSAYAGAALISFVIYLNISSASRKAKGDQLESRTIDMMETRRQIELVDVTKGAS